MHLCLDFHELQEPKELFDLWLRPETDCHQLIHCHRLTKLVCDLSILESNNSR